MLYQTVFFLSHYVASLNRELAVLTRKASNSKKFFSASVFPISGDKESSSPARLSYS